MIETVAQNGTAQAPDTTISNTQHSSSRHSKQEKQWNHRRASIRSEKQNDAEEHQRLSRETSRRSSKRQRRWWKIRFFRGMIDDVKRRAPYYLSDWTDAWDYRVVPATVYMYFAKYVAQAQMLMHLLLLHLRPSLQDTEFRLLQVARMSSDHGLQDRSGRMGDDLLS